MKRLKFTQRTMIQTHEPLKKLLKRRLLELEDYEAHFDGNTPTIESVTAALWYWLIHEPASANAFWLENIYPELEEEMRRDLGPSAPRRRREPRPPAEEPPAPEPTKAGLATGAAPVESRALPRKRKAAK